MYKLNSTKFRELLLGMRKAFIQNTNMMEWARNFSKNKTNSLQSTLISYDLQSGSYVAYTEKNPKYNKIWGEQLAKFINLKLCDGDTLLEVGVGEATTLSSVFSNLKFKNIKLYGFDISWSRLYVAKNYLAKKNVTANLFVANLFNIPLADDSIDIVYTSHSLEPNGGKEKEAIAECLRVSKKALILFEPIYELATSEAKKRMTHHGYVKQLKETALKLGASVEYFELLKKCGNKLNPSGVIVLTKSNKKINHIQKLICPITKTELVNYGSFCFYSFFSSNTITL